MSSLLRLFRYYIRDPLEHLLSQTGNGPYVLCIASALFVNLSVKGCK